MNKTVRPKLIIRTTNILGEVVTKKERLEEINVHDIKPYELNTNQKKRKSKRSKKLKELIEESLGKEDVNDKVSLFDVEEDYEDKKFLKTF